MDDPCVSPVTCDLPESSTSAEASEKVGRVVHALANKLLPITVFCELALQRCHDPIVTKDLERIHKAAEEARKLITQIRSELVQEPPNPSETLRVPVEAP